MNNKPIIRARNVMKKDFISMNGMATVQEGINALRHTDTHAIIIDKRDDNDEYGIVVLADIAKKILAADKSTERVNLYEIMSKPALSVDPEMDIRYCARLLYRFGISIAPVIQDRKILGLITYADIIMHRLETE